MLEWDFTQAVCYSTLWVDQKSCCVGWIHVSKLTQARTSFTYISKEVSPKSFLSCWTSIWNHHIVAHQFPSSTLFFDCWYYGPNAEEHSEVHPSTINISRQPCHCFSRWHIISFSVYQTRDLINILLIKFPFLLQLWFLYYLLSVELTTFNLSFPLRY